MNSTQSVTVVIPTYNRANTIERAIRSVLSQNYPILEIIVVDDGSTDNTLSIIQNIQSELIKVIRTEGRTGAPHARNIGIQNAVGSWIAFQDSDDFWLPDKLRKQMDTLLANPSADACFCQLIQLYSDAARVIPFEAQNGYFADVFSALIRDSFISTQTFICKAAALLKIGGFDANLPRLQDWDLVLRLARNEVKFVCTAEPLVIAYETAGSLTSSQMRGVDAREMVLEKHSDLQSKYPYDFSRHYYIMASLSAKGADASRAYKYATRATVLQPKKLANYVILIRSMLMRLVNSFMYAAK